jgi:hypothetical protein
MPSPTIAVDGFIRPPGQRTDSTTDPANQDEMLDPSSRFPSR